MNQTPATQAAQVHNQIDYLQERVDWMEGALQAAPDYADTSEMDDLCASYEREIAELLEELEATEGAAA